jgi:hypothetical protein
MKNRHRLLSWILAFAGSAAFAQPGAAESALSVGSAPTGNAVLLVLEIAREASEASARWIVDRADNICGLDDPRMLSKPAKLDYDLLLAATPEIKKMRDDKVDPNSSEGIQLRQKAVDRIRNAADKVRVSEGYCSVWKAIRNQDGRVVGDVTELVRTQM